MPRCQGLPDEPCPDRKNDNTVRNGEGDLMLCRRCDDTRHKQWLVSRDAAKAKVDDIPIENKRGKSTCTSVPSTSVPATSAEDAGRAGSESSLATSACGPTTSTTVERPLMACELLYFLSNKYDSHPRDSLQSVLANFYQEDEILAAKKILVQCIDITILPSAQVYTKKRVGDNKQERCIDDILNLYGVIDENGYRAQLPLFCAVSQARVPVMQNEIEISDISVMKSEIVQLSKKIDSVCKALPLLNGLRESVSNIEKKMSGFDTGGKHLGYVSGQFSHNVHIATPDEQFADNLPHNGGAVGTDREREIGESLAVSNDSESKLVESDHRPIFAELAKTCTSDDFKVVPNRKGTRAKAKKPVVVGSSNKSDVLCGVARKTVLCINRLEPNTSTDAMSQFLQSAGVTVYSCYKIEPKRSNEIIASKRSDPRFVGMRICVSQSDINKLYDADLWPYGVTVWPWVFKPRTEVGKLGSECVSPDDEMPLHQSNYRCA